MCRAAVLSLLLLAVSVRAGDPEPKLIIKPDAFKTLVNPNCSHCRDEAKRRAGELRDGDRALCWIRGYSDGGAIPFRFFLNPYRVISDTYGVFVHDADAGFARGFAPSVDFTFQGWRNGVMVMKHKDGTLYSCLTGRAFAGPRKGDRLKPIATLVSDWGPWTRQYPHNVAYHMFDKYQPVELPAKPNDDSVKSRGPLDKRLPADELVLGVVAGREARAYPLDKLAKVGLIRDKIDGAALVVLWQGETRTAAAYRPVAMAPGKNPEAKPRPVTLTRDDRNKWDAFTDKETGSRWDVAGRAVAGELKGWTLEWVDSTVVRWFAFAAEVPQTTIHGQAAAALKTQGTAAAIQEVAGTAEFLRHVPKKLGVLKTVDADRRRITFQADGEHAAREWALDPEAEIKRDGWWGRLTQFKPGERAWIWLRTDRQKQPTAVFLLADEASAQDIHRTKVTVPDFEAKRQAQRTWLRRKWLQEGLPGTVSYAHYHGEIELLLDHEAMRWGRSLKTGDRVEVAAEPPIKAVVRAVSPLRERTRVTLVVNGQDLGDFAAGQRRRLKMPEPSAAVEESVYPSDIDRLRTRAERIEWFLASIYCTCGVGNDTCTGDFYTLAACNPNACGMPKQMRAAIGAKIDRSLTDRQIFDELLKERGPALLRPHLLP